MLIGTFVSSMGLGDLRNKGKSSWLTPRKALETRQTSAGAQVSFSARDTWPAAHISLRADVLRSSAHGASPAQSQQSARNPETLNGWVSFPTDAGSGFRRSG